MNESARKELERLTEGNKRFINGNCSCEKRKFEALKNFMDFQTPKTLILSCSDSRVIPEFIFDCGIGELFVIRTAGATIGLTLDVLESIEFGISKIKTSLLILLGHDDCGITKYAKDCFFESNEFYKSIMSTIIPVAQNSDDHHDEITKIHTKTLKKLLIERSAIIKEAVEKDNLAIVEGHFNFKTGKFELI